jgi:hypothetical protein
MTEISDDSIRIGDSDLQLSRDVYSTMSLSTAHPQKLRQTCRKHTYFVIIAQQERRIGFKRLTYQLQLPRLVS